MELTYLVEDWRENNKFCGFISIFLIRVYDFRGFTRKIVKLNSQYIQDFFLKNKIKITIDKYI